MKTTMIAAAIALTAGMGQAADFNIAGQTFTIGGEVDANYTTGVELFAVEATQTVGFDAFGLDFSAEHTVDVMTLNDADFELFNGLDLEAGYDVTTSLRAYTKVNMDKDFELGNITTGMTFAF